MSISITGGFEMRRIKFLSVFALLALLSSVGPGVAMAQDPPPEPQVIQDIPVEPAMQEAAEANAATASKFGIPAIEEKELQRRIERWDEEVVKERARLEPPDPEVNSGAQILAEDPGGGGGGGTAVPIGTNYTFTYASEGKNGHSSSGMSGSTTSYNLSQRRNNVSAWAYGVGNASGWAWTGRRFTVSGTGSRLCYVDFVGWAGVNLLGGYGGRASWKVVVKVFDATVGSYIGQATVFDEYSANNQIIVDGGDYSRSVLVSLRAGHTYVVYVVTYGDVNQWGVPPAWFISEMESGTDSLHTKWNQIRLRWQ